MPLLSWSEKFSINVEMVDEQHRRLFDLINTLYDLVTSKSAGKALTDALDALIDYTKYHFRQEEDLMIKIDYVRYNQHKLEHESLAKRAADFREMVSGGKGDAAEFLNFLYSWLTKHIMEQDKKIGKYIEQKTLKPIDDVI